MTLPVPVWLVTVSDCYYPCEGTRDWHKILDDEREAREYYNSIKLGWGQTAYLIRIYGTAYNEIEYREAPQV